MSKEQIWLQYFNPCGAQVVEGYGNKRCISKDCGRIPCLQRASYIAAEALLQGSNTATEKQEISGYLGDLTGKPVIDLKGETVQVGRGEIHQIAQQVIDHANRFIDGVESCMRNTEPIGPTTTSDLPNYEQDVLSKLYELNFQARSFRGDEQAARELAMQIQTKLAIALEFGLGRIDLIARQALAYGLADKLPFIDATGLIFLGNPLNITHMK